MLIAAIAAMLVPVASSASAGPAPTCWTEADVYKTNMTGDVSPCTVPIPGCRTVARVEENAGALTTGPLTAAQLDVIGKI